MEEEEEEVPSEQNERETIAKIAPSSAKKEGEGSAQTTNLPSAFLVASLLPSSWPRDVIIEDSEPERPGNWLFRQSDRRSNAAFTEGKFSLLHCVFSDGQKYVKCSENRLF